MSIIPRSFNFMPCPSFSRACPGRLFHNACDQPLRDPGRCHLLTLLLLSSLPPFFSCSLGVCNRRYIRICEPIRVYIYVCIIGPNICLQCFRHGFPQHSALCLAGNRRILLCVDIKLLYARRFYPVSTLAIWDSIRNSEATAKAFL